MAVLADVTAQSLSTATSNGKNLPIAQPTTNKESRIREHPFMKEVKISLAFISIIYFLSLSPSVYYKWLECFYSKCRYIT